MLDTNLNGLRLANPVMTASGTFGYGEEYKDFVELKRLGAIIVKGISLSPSAGNPPPRVVETACGMLNAIGLANIGIEMFVKDRLPFLETLGCPVIVNIYGQTVNDYARLAEIINGVAGIHGIEVNISCPNVKAGGLAFGVDPVEAANVVSAVRQKTDKYLMVKLTPNVTDIATIAASVEDAGAEAVSLINTLAGMAVDVKTRRPKLTNITGGLSGPAIKPVALKMVWEVARRIHIPVVGIGGIITAEDALEFIIAGASAVQVGTANFINPGVTGEIIDGIQAFLKENNIAAVSDLIGTLEC